MSKEAEVLDSMRGIIDPDLGKDIVTLGFIKNLTISDAGEVGFTVELTTPACPVKEQFKQACNEAVSALPWVTGVSVAMGAQERRGGMPDTGPGLAQVKHIIAVASCKGGVGKSTVAVNLAFAIARQGARVGIFDADIYGPSLPTMVQAKFDGLYQDQNQMIIPVDYEGLKLMSFAYANSKQGDPAVMRGPMVTSVVNQLVGTTNWGELDYLIIDMPPGTGDIQLTLSQVIPMTAAVMVTTPQEISFVDVVKGIKMFDMMHVPTVAVVENMSYFICGSCETRHEIFGAGAMKKLIEQFGFGNAFSLPIDAAISACSDAGRPIVIEYPDSEPAKAYQALANAVIREISTMLFSDAPKPSVKVEPGRGIIFRGADGLEKVIHAAVLRRHCRCARCINEMTGEKTLRDQDVAEDIAANQISTMGNYAVAIAWSDGHSSIYPYDMLRDKVPANDL
ncbi:MAG: P-loop NTPase [Verrucomicrobia bacterium]|nr:P-loop NTPase [Verrucomicrobiota bacterium]